MALARLVQTREQAEQAQWDLQREARRLEEEEQRVRYDGNSLRPPWPSGQRRGATGSGTASDTADDNAKRTVVFISNKR